jgi:DNA-binding CsgD family transcriptional regulator
LIAYAALTEALAELDLVRAQVREARATERASRFYRLVRAAPSEAESTDHVAHVANVIELSGGSVMVHWLHEPKALTLYSSMAAGRLALSAEAGLLLILDEVAERSSVHNQGAGSAHTALMPADRRILGELRRGLSNKEIALKIGLSESTVKNRLTDLYKKLGDDIEDRLQAVMLTRDWNLEDEA